MMCTQKLVRNWLSRRGRMQKLLLVLAGILTITISSVALAAEKKEWTILVFLNGNNNLDSFGALNINQMEKVGSTDKMNIVVQWASLENGTTKRVLVQKDEDMNTVTSPVIADIGNVDMGSAQTLEDFVVWGAQNYPADHYLVDVWDHGSGWHNLLRADFAAAGIKVRPNFGINDISWDDNTGNHITTEQLGQTMRNIAATIGKKIDVYSSDACLMAMAEVAAEMDTAVDYFAGSQDLEPGAGWPYDTWLERVQNGPSTPRDVVIALADEYLKSYSGGTNGRDEVTFSAYDMSKMGPVKDTTRRVGESILALSPAGKAKVAKAAQFTSTYYYSDYADYVHFLKNMESSKIDEIDSESIAAAVQAAQDFVVVNRVSGSYPNSSGLSFWLPKSKYTYNNYLSRYQGLQFDKDSSWSRALGSFVK
jgi:hypothetical protein